MMTEQACLSFDPGSADTSADRFDAMYESRRAKVARKRRIKSAILKALAYTGATFTVLVLLL
ncbi:MAG: hypothetical protein LUB61_03820, partial [Eggerthellaceae bacterium]|nr:hypothetical protein [Eggerthellaceae bacterium]